MRVIQLICLLMFSFCTNCSLGQEKDPIRQPTTEASNAVIDDPKPSDGINFKIIGKKLEGTGNYELGFTAPANSQWQIFSPNQDLSGTKAAELVFADSSISQQGNFVIETELTKV